MLTYWVKNLWLNLEDFLKSSNLIFSQLISHLWFMNENAAHEYKNPGMQCISLGCDLLNLKKKW